MSSRTLMWGTCGSRWIRALALAAVVLAMSLVPVGTRQAGAATHSAAASPITVWDIQTGSEQKALLAMAADFTKAHPGTTVQYQWFVPDPYKTKIAIAIGAHHAPDIFMGWGGGVLGSYVKSGAVVDLTSALTADPAWKNRYVQSVLGAATFNGHIYAVPYNESQPEVVIYNKAIFAKYGLSVPTTWPQLLNVVKVLNSHNVIPFAMAGKVMWPEMIVIQYLAERLGGPGALQNIALQKPGASFNSPAWSQAITLAQDLVKMNAFENGFSAFDYHAGADAAQLLYTGRAAMMFMGVWEIGSARDNSPSFAKTMGFFPVPAVPGGKGKLTDLIGNPANYYSVSTDSKNPTAAIAFLKETLNPTFSKELLAEGTVPPVAKLDLGGIADPLLLQEVSLLKTSTNYQQPVDQLLAPELAQDFLDLTSKAFTLSITPQQFASTMQSDTASYFATHH